MLCLNCRTALDGAMRFCPQCGQKTSVKRLTLREIAHDAWHALTHTDHSFLALVKALLVRPGTVMREYVEGRRKAYFNPFAFLIVVVGVSSVAMTSSGFGGFEGSGHPVARFLQTHLNLLILAQVPLLALFARLLFAGSGRNLAEYLVLAAYASGLRSIFVSLVMVPLTLALKQAGWGPSYRAQVLIYLLIWAAYFAWVSLQFHAAAAPRRPVLDAFRGFAVAVLTQLSSSALIALAFRLVPR